MKVTGATTAKVQAKPRTAAPGTLRGPAVRLSSAEAPALLRAAGLRVTAPRVATFDVVREHPHSDADSITRHVRQRLGAVSRQAVYDVLRALSEAELVRPVHVDSRRTLYELQHHDDHHHAVCTRCGCIEDVPCATQHDSRHDPCLLPPGPTGFTIEATEVIYRGLCSACRPTDSLTAPQSSTAPASDNPHQVPTSQGDNDG